eukprot:TRINITY_DN5986_c0_g1_i6.p1 TRINITY_DN5986_c0_g1~~TRINITY_DN5986_c0_g1_i6.p1  ORF type:complete len:405 (-),score=90.85 TRINITY_DN5986_c0_g1_i6:310-1464(-)
MCIRDRYQRRVHGDYFKENRMKDIDEIYDLLLVEDQPLEDICTSFSKDSNLVIHRGQIVASLLLGNLLTRGQRLTASYLLLNSFIQEGQTLTKSNPFVPIVIEIAERSNDAQERKFIYEHLKNPKEKGGLSIKKFLGEVEPFVEQFELPEDFKEIKKIATEAITPVKEIEGADVHKVVTNYKVEEVGDIFPLNTLQPGSITADEYNISGYSPDFIRPLPEEMPISKDELHFVNMTTLPDVQWDFTMGIDINMQAIAKEYFAKALKQKLNDAEEKLLTETITEPKVVKSIGMDVNFLPQLTELNTKVAVAVMAAMSAVPAQFKEYLDKLLTMDVSLLHSFELLNSLLSLKIEIPKDYLRTFVKHSIETIGKLKGQKVSFKLKRWL